MTVRCWLMTSSKSTSRFFVSFGDDIMKRFAPEWVPGMMQKMGLTEDMPLESKMVTRAIAQSQVKVEGHNFDVVTGVLGVIIGPLVTGIASALLSIV